MKRSNKSIINKKKKNSIISKKNENFQFPLEIWNLIINFIDITTDTIGTIINILSVEKKSSILLNFKLSEFFNNYVKHRTGEYYDYKNKTLSNIFVGINRFLDVMGGEYNITYHNFYVICKNTLLWSQQPINLINMLMIVHLSELYYKYLIERSNPTRTRNKRLHLCVTNFTELKDVFTLKEIENTGELIVEKLMSQNIAVVDIPNHDCMFIIITITNNIFIFIGEDNGKLFKRALKKINKFDNEDDKYIYKIAIKNMPIQERRAFIYDLLSEDINILIPKENDMLSSVIIQDEITLKYSHIDLPKNKHFVESCFKYPADSDNKSAFYALKLYKYLEEYVMFYDVYIILIK